LLSADYIFISVSCLTIRAACPTHLIFLDLSILKVFVETSSTSQFCAGTVTIKLKPSLMIVDAPWCVPHTVIGEDFQTPTVKEEIHRYSSQYSARFRVHPNDQVMNFMVQPDSRRL
jgi:hypothetical protein